MTENRRNYSDLGNFIYLWSLFCFFSETCIILFRKYTVDFQLCVIKIWLVMGQIFCNVESYPPSIFHNHFCTWQPRSKDLHKKLGNKGKDKTTSQ